MGDGEDLGDEAAGLRALPHRRPGHRHWPVLIGLLWLSACGGGGGDGGNSTNLPPTSSFSASATTGAVPLQVAFDAAGSRDTDGSIVAYQWIFGDGDSATGVTVGHTFASAGTFTVTLTVTDDLGASSSTSRAITVTVGPPAAEVTVSGRITFERVPFSLSTMDGLDYARTLELPAREIEVELLQASSRSVLQTGITDGDGRFALRAPQGTQVILRAKAQSRHSATTSRPASWNLRVLNNTNSNALYVLDGSPFDTGTADQTRNLKAATGWGGGFAGTYTGVRAAAPFAILDTLYQSVQFVVSNGNGSVQLPPLDAFWSVDNVPADGDVDAGQIGTTSYYPGGNPAIASGIYVLGAADRDTDEFDQHIVAHEYLHYLEDTLSRTDTIGGSHSLTERLDMRVAFSEGFANAFSAMVLGDPGYRDSYGVGQGEDFGFDMEVHDSAVPGWYSEASVHGIVWDLFDSNAMENDMDQVQVGFDTMYEVLAGPLRTGVPLTSIFPFITSLKQAVDAVTAARMDERIEDEGGTSAMSGIDSIAMDAYASTETHPGVENLYVDTVLPVYTRIGLGETGTVCASAVTGSYNKLGNRRFLRFEVPVRRSITISAACAAAPDAPCSGTPAVDPDFQLSSGAFRSLADGLGPTESLTLTLEPGEYVVEVYDYSHVDQASNADRRGKTCMNVNISG